jgi:hypothetical protein
VSLEEVASRARYTGSPYHKDMPSFAGSAPRRRGANASLCPRELARQQSLIQEWLRTAIRSGQFSGSWEHGFPRFVWCRQDGGVYEARLTNAGTGEYHGYPLEDDQHVEGLP